MSVDPRHPPPASPIVEALTWPTRSAQIHRVIDAVAAGSSVVLAYSAPDGAQHVASAIADALSTQARVPVVHADASSSPEDVLGPPGADGSTRVILGAHLLPKELSQPLEDRLSSPAAPLVLLVDVDSFDGLKVAAEPSVMGVLSRLWGQDWLVRADLLPLSDPEAVELARRYDSASLLDELQLATIAATGAGSPLLIADLTEDALASPAVAPRHLARPSTDATVYSPRTTLRAATLLRSLEPELASAAQSIAIFGPLTVSVAHQVLGSATVDRLLSRGVAHRADDRHRRCVWVSTLMLTALTDHIPGRAPRSLAAETHREKLELLWQHGGVSTDNTIATLALLRQGSPASDRSRALSGAAASVTARWGAVAETEVLLRSAQPLPPFGSTGVRAALIAGDHALALTLARDIIQATDRPGEATLDAVFDAAVACSWLGHVPDWFEEVLSGRVEELAPGLAASLRFSMSARPLAASDVPALRAIALLPSAHLAARLLACTHWCKVSRDLDDMAGLQEALGTASELLARAEAHAEQPCSTLLEEARLLLLLTAGVSRTVTGVHRGHLERDLAALCRDAVALTRRSGWLQSSVALALQGILAGIGGQRERATRNLRAATAGLRPAVFAPVYAALSSITVSVWPEYSEAPASPGLVGLHGTARDRLTPAAREALEALISSTSLGTEGSRPAVGWLKAMRWHTAVVTGEVSAQEALAALSETPQAAPTSRARLQHLEAMMRQDKDALFAVAAPLTELGLVAAARSALSAAHELSLAARATMQALRCAQALHDLAAALPWDGEPTLEQERPLAHLSERELEVARLVASGLSNTEIAKRLFLSVRTVESHVLRARAKLGAAGRAEVRHRLELAGDDARPTA